MSLTSFIEQADVRDKFRKEFKKPQFLAKQPLLAPPITKNYSLVGTAFDYLLRFYIQRVNPIAITEPWIAECSLKTLSDDSLLHEKAEKIISLAKENLTSFLKTGELTDPLIESALSLAYLDPIFRVGYGHEHVGTTISPGDKRDLVNLIFLVKSDLFRASYFCHLNPTFGASSRLVGGADADLIIDDTIIDIKTTIKFTLSGDSFNQLLGYYILHLRNNRSLQHKHKINKIGIYFARYGFFYKLDLADIINKDTFPDFVAWFEQRARMGMRYNEQNQEADLTYQLRLL